eukprot:gene5170-6602_t
MASVLSSLDRPSWSKSATRRLAMGRNWPGTSCAASSVLLHS